MGIRLTCSPWPLAPTILSSTRKADQASLDTESPPDFSRMAPTLHELSIDHDANSSSSSSSSPSTSPVYLPFSDCNSDRSESFSSPHNTHLLLVSCGSDDLIHSVISDLDSSRPLDPSRPLDLRRRAAFELRLLTKNKPDICSRIDRADAIKPLVSLISSSDPQLQEYCVTAILNIALCDDNKGLIVSSGAIGPLMRALRSGKATARENAACALLWLSQVEENKTAISRGGEILPLVELLEMGISRGKKDAATALYSLCSIKENKVRRRRSVGFSRSLPRRSQIIIQSICLLNMSQVDNDPLLRGETTCGTLLCELQVIWDEVGESDAERDEMLLELERECLEVYRRKVDQASRYRAKLRQTMADQEAELAAICSAMGERPVSIRQPDQNAESLKDELKRILPQLEEMRKRKNDRQQQFLEVLQQLQRISNELNASAKHMPLPVTVDDSDLSLRKLEELHKQLQALQLEKSNRLKQVQEYLNALHSLCLALGLDFNVTTSEIPFDTSASGGTGDISTGAIERLALKIHNLRETKVQRMQKIQDFATTLLGLWSLMDTPAEEQQKFQYVTRNVAALEHEITDANALSLDTLSHVESEVARLEGLKLSKMKELVFKKRSDFEDICRRTHLIPEDDTTMEAVLEAMKSGLVDADSVLQKFELQMAKVKEEAFSRKELLERVEKWLAACDEESWLEEYNRDENRYNAGRGAHLTLKRAEKARSLVNKLPAMVEALTSKTVAWEKERGTDFTYDGVRLLSMLDDYNILRQAKEEQRRRLRDQKKLQGQLMAEQEALYGSKPSPSKIQNAKKAPRTSTGIANNRKLSLGGTMLAQTPKIDRHSIKSTPHSRPGRKNERENQIDRLNLPQDDFFVGPSPVGKKVIDATGRPIKNNSFVSVNAHEPESPMVRKPFSPLASTASTKLGGRINSMDESSFAPVEAAHKIAPGSAMFATPSKTVSIVDEENRTPKVMPTPMPATPLTVSVPMHTAMTPNSLPLQVAVPMVKDIPEEVEYSFEERRMGFMVSGTKVKSVIQF
ncbi:hypothetical protein MLD38_025638 [Melastoma candidum]|uniref:Uncharacterized protein n=1 Tax=Melastoma candidum TaxID=119954 RepID=A0ACB9NWY9_9MYRT|nr:hypothetical protein MLD38_025638 [Melastoma candidum]